MSLRQFSKTTALFIPRQYRNVINICGRKVQLTSVRASHSALRINYRENGQSKYMLCNPELNFLASAPCRGKQNLPKKQVQHTEMAHKPRIEWNKGWMGMMFFLTIVLVISGLR